MSPLPPERWLTGTAAVRPYLTDATEARGITGRADAVALPASPDEVGAVLRWCAGEGVTVTVRGGGTGYAAGAVPDGGVVLCLERLRDVRSFEPGLWRGEVEAGVTTATVQRRARESGLLYPVDPGAAESSHIGGNVATNAGGPHALRHGTTRAWVTGLEAVLPSGEVVRTGRGLRKDVAGYDLAGLLCGSEGTLAVVTAVSLRFVPRPETRLPVAATYVSLDAVQRAIEAALASGVVPSVLELLDEHAFASASGSYPGSLPAGHLLITEAEGDPGEAERARAELRSALTPGALAVDEPEPRALWRWRDGVSHAVTAVRGGKISEDLSVPVDRVADLVAGAHAIAGRVGLPVAVWGHAGDGNLHPSLLVDRTDPDQLARAHAAAHELFALALELGGSVTGEHGIGRVKPLDQLSEPERRLHRSLKQSFDPGGLLNPGVKAAPPASLAS